MPGIISPTGTYSRMRRPISAAACLSWSAMPCSIWSSIDSRGRPMSSAAAYAAAIERALCDPRASLTPPSPGSRGVDSRKTRAICSKQRSVCHFSLQTLQGQPICSAWIVS